MSDDYGIDMTQVLALSKNLKGIEPELRKELHKGLRDGAKPLVPVLREEIRKDYPKKGEMAAKIAKAPVRIAVKTGGDAVTIQVIFKGITVKLAEVYGFFRHPVFPKEGTTRKEQHWVSQDLATKGRLEFASKRSVTLITPHVRKAVQDVVDKVVSRSG